MAQLRRETLAEEVGYFLDRLIRYLVETYKKPIITTTFTEGGARLRGGQYAYPSGQRAAKVLAKLVEYQEYLNSCQEKVPEEDSARP
jgi:hypothetical protein